MAQGASVLVTTLLALLTGVAASQASAADWPQWRGPERNGVAPDSPPLAASWTEAGPRKLWENHDLKLAPAQYAGGHSCPAIANGRVYVYAHDVGAPRDTIACFDLDTGKLLWRRDIEGQKTWHGGSGTPAVTGDRLLVSAARLAYCLDANTGEVVWQVDLNAPPAPGQEVSSSFLVVGEMAIVMAGETLGLDTASGKVLWRAPTGAGYASVMASAAPWEHEGKVYAVYGGAGRLACIAPATGQVVWELTTDKGRGEPAPSPAITGDHMVMWFVDQLVAYRLALRGPEKLWAAELPDDYASPVIWKGRVYTVGQHDDGVKASVRCRDMLTGKVQWDTRVNAPEFSSPILADGKLLVLTDRNANLRMLDAETGRVLGSMHVGAQVWSSPSFADGKVVVRIPDGVACWDLTEQANPAPMQRAETATTERYVEVTEATKDVCGYSMSHQDASITGSPLLIGNKVFRHGIGTHAPCELIFALDPGCRWVTFYVGASGDQRQGSVSVQVWLDDRLAYETPVMRGQDEALYVSLSAAGFRQLRFVGTDGGDGNAWDHINIANLRLSCAAQQPAPDGPLETRAGGE